MNGVYKQRNHIGFDGIGGLAQMGAGVTTSLIGAYGFIKSEKDRKKYDKMAVPSYTEDPEMTKSRLRADEAANYGFNNTQRSLFFQNLARMSAQRLRQGNELAGGSLSQSLNAGNTANQLQALNSFAGQDAQLQDNHIKYDDAFHRNLQILRNLNTQKDYSAYIAKGQAIAKQRGDSLKNIVGGQQMFGSGASQFGGSSMGGGGSNGGQQTIIDNSGMGDLPQEQYDPNAQYQG